MPTTRRPHLLTPAVTAALACLLIAAGPAAPSARFVYRGHEGLTVMDVDGGTELVLGVSGSGAAWSPDGSRIAYADASGIWMIPAAGGEPTLVVAAAGVATIAWSPDGYYLAYDTPYADRLSSGIWVVALFDDDYAAPPGFEVTSAPAGMVDLEPTWAPDGSAIAFRRHDLRTNYPSLMLQEITPRFPSEWYRETVLSDQADVAAFSAPSWSPDGRHLAFIGIPRTGDTAGRSHLYRIARDGTGLEVLVPDGAWRPTAPTYAPDGRSIAYGKACSDGCTQQEAEGSAAGGLWTLDLETRTSTQLVSVEGTERDWSWSPDGGSLVFGADFADSGCHCTIADLYAVGVDGGAPRQLDTFIVGSPTPVMAPGRTVRAAGPTRVETAVAVARAAFDRADTLVVARFDGYADALAGAALAGALGAPVVLSTPDALPFQVELEIRRLGVSRIVLLGDESALSTRLEEHARFLVPEVERIGGPTRFATAALVAEHLPADHAFVVQGASADPARGWPDAVAVAGLAGALAEPILPVERDRLPDETAHALTDGGIQRVTIVGGVDAVSQAVATAIAELGIAVERLAGATRYATSAAVAERAIAAGLDPDATWAATGRDWPDTLAAGPAAAAAGGVLVLVDGHDLAGSPESARPAGRASARADLARRRARRRHARGPSRPRVVPGTMSAGQASSCRRPGPRPLRRAPKRRVPSEGGRTWDPRRAINRSSRSRGAAPGAPLGSRLAHARIAKSLNSADQ